MYAAQLPFHGLLECHKLVTVSENMTEIVVVTFLGCHIIFLAYKVARNGLKPLELTLLSSLSILPAVFVFLEPAVTSISNFLGITYPFVLMFALLNFCFFLLISKLMDKVNKLSKDISDIAQQVGLQTVKEKSPRQRLNTTEFD